MTKTTSAPTSTITMAWEDGVRTIEGIKFPTKSAAYAEMDRIFRVAQYPTSLAVVLSEDGVPFWGQHGTTVMNIAVEK